MGENPSEMTNMEEKRIFQKKKAIKIEIGNRFDLEYTDIDVLTEKMILLKSTLLAEFISLL